MAEGRITKRTVDSLKAAKSDYVRWDGDLKGFGVRVRPSGAKSFVAVFRTGGRNTPLRKITIGTFGKLTVEQARVAAARILAKAELGEDEAAAKSESRTAKTVAQLCEIYLAEGCDKKKPSTIAVDRGRIARHIVPLLGRKLVTTISSAEIEQFMHDVAKGKTAADVKTVKFGRAVVRGGKGTATRTVRLLGGIFSFAVRRKLRKDNPVRGIEKYPDRKSERFLSTGEFERLGAAIREAETIGLQWEVDDQQPNSKHVAKRRKPTIISPHVAAAFRLLIFTGCRLRVILRLRWGEVDFERGMLFLPDSKTGRKAVVLNAIAIQVLGSLERLGNHVIAGDDAGTEQEKPRADLKRPWRAMTRRAGLDGLRIHDLRHSFASVGAGGGMGLPIVGKLLGHADHATTARYAHLDNDPLRRASNTIGKAIADAMDGNVAADRTIDSD
jgi:integrase